MFEVLDFVGTSLPDKMKTKKGQTMEEAMRRDIIDYRKMVSLAFNLSTS